MALSGTIGGRFVAGEKIGAGSFGVVYIGNDFKNKRSVAIKVEAAKATHRCLAHEVDAYRHLRKTSVTPQLLWEGRLADDSRAMVTELLGPSLEDLFAMCKRRFSLKTTLALADQMLTCLEAVHAAGLMHRDLKPDNFLIGLGPKANTVYLIDYGLATPWLDRKSKTHVKFREGRGRVGTAWYSSQHASLGLQQSRRDDLESLGYIMLHFLRGSLPWQHATLFCHTDAERFQEIMQRKRALSIPDLCGRFPWEIGEYVRYCRDLKFEECPDYAFLRNLLADCYSGENFEPDGIFDWTFMPDSPAGDAKREAPFGKNISRTITPCESEWLTSEDGEF
mmetsp:Transcript_11493/g.33138  ORF Transcript_11493/g.33138 Transcript_11493/m.33138 type:complete len:336 (-) Transcript_11493:671-1678(-)